MLKPEILEILCCPETRQPLALASVELMESLNSKIAAGALKNRSGEVVRDPIEGALIREDHQFAYVIRKTIPVLLIDQAIALA